ncbi:transposase family protein [Eubacteriales bacterium OttesenSCG-928-A19]|nr:transposase family protein [Eubacteriales bacterium OttesenSCG-928-A19]
MPDPRQAWKVKHPLVEILMLSIIATTAGQTAALKSKHLAATGRSDSGGSWR